MKNCTGDVLPLKIVYIVCLFHDNIVDYGPTKVSEQDCKTKGIREACPRIDMWRDRGGLIPLFLLRWYH